MKTEVITVSSKGKGIDEALSQVESAAGELGLEGKDALHLRLIAEEMLNMMRSIIGDLEGKFWVDSSDDVAQLHLQAVTLLDRQQRKQLISASSSGKNEAHRGIMGKILAFFEPMPIDDTPEYLLDSCEASENGDLTWSLNAYKERLRGNLENGEAKEEWDELEKSLISHLADDIKVSIRGYDVDLVISRKNVR